MSMQPAGISSSAAPKPGGVPGGAFFSPEYARKNQLQENLAREHAKKQTGRPLETIPSAPTAATETEPEVLSMEDRALEAWAQDLETGRLGEDVLAARLTAQQQMDRLRVLRAADDQARSRAKYQEEIRKTARVAIRRGVEYAFNFIASAFNVTVVAIVVNVFIYAFTLVDLNIQMIYGYYIARDKSLLFPALKWAPLRVPLPDIMLHGVVVFADIFLFLSVVVIGLAMFILFFAPMLTVGSFASGAWKYITDASFRTAVNQIIGI